MKINRAELFINSIDIKNIANINILVCYKILFSKKGILYNYGSYFLNIIILLHLLVIIIFYSKNLFRNIEDIINEITFGIKNLHLFSKTKEELAVNIIKIKKNKKTKKKKSIIKKRKLNSKITDSNQETINDRFNIHKRKVNINESNNINLLYLKKERNEKKNKKFDNNINSLNTTKKNKEIYNKVINIMKCNDDELNDLEYEKALKIDKRNYCQFYISLLKTKHDILFTFFINNDYNSKIVKIDLLLFNFVLEFTINALFFSDDTMHKIYEDNGSFNFLYQLPQILYSAIISRILNILLGMLALSQNIILEYKNSKRSDNLNQKKISINKIIKIKLIIYFIISSIFLYFFWYYISMFCAIYVNAQIHLIKDTLISYFVSLFSPLLFNLIPAIFRILSLHNNKSKRKFLYTISKIIQMI